MGNRADFSRVRDIEPLAAIAVQAHGAAYCYLSDRLKGKWHLFDQAFHTFKRVVEDAPKSLAVPEEYYKEAVRFHDETYRNLPEQVRARPAIALAQARYNEIDPRQWPESLHKDREFLLEIKAMVEGREFEAVDQMLLKTEADLLTSRTRQRITPAAGRKL